MRAGSEVTSKAGVETPPRECYKRVGSKGTHMSEQAESTGQEEEQLPEFVALYRRAFADYRVQALWNMRFFERPTEADALVVARALRVEGDMQARRLAEQIEQVCRAAV
jgi:hypothetical protein